MDKDFRKKRKRIYLGEDHHLGSGLRYTQGPGQCIKSVPDLFVRADVEYLTASIIGAAFEFPISRTMGFLKAFTEKRSFMNSTSAVCPLRKRSLLRSLTSRSYWENTSVTFWWRELS
jgi:hypothetical protein